MKFGKFRFYDLIDLGSELQKWSQDRADFYYKSNWLTLLKLVRYLTQFLTTVKVHSDLLKD